MSAPVADLSEACLDRTEPFAWTAEGDAACAIRMASLSGTGMCPSAVAEGIMEADVILDAAACEPASLEAAASRIAATRAALDLAARPVAGWDSIRFIRAEDTES